MGVFIHNDITDRGRILLGDAQVGATFEATKIVMGSGYIPSGYTARTMTGVVAPVIELAINKARRAGDGTVTFGGMFSNETITEAFYFREFALYARVKRADGTYSDEVCYSYGNAGDNADLLPAYSAGAVVEKQMDLVTYIGNDTEVRLTIASGLNTLHAETHAAGGEDPIAPESIGAEKVLGVVPDDDLLVWVDKQTTGGSFLIAPDRTTKNIPTASVSWFIGHLDYNVSGKRVTMTDLNSLKTWTNVTRNNVFTGWVEIANAKDFLPLDGSVSMTGNLLVANGLGALVANNGSVLVENRNGRIRSGFVVYTELDTNDRFKVFDEDGGVLRQWNILHEGNAPVEVATAELI